MKLLPCSIAPLAAVIAGLVLAAALPAVAANVTVQVTDDAGCASTAPVGDSTATIAAWQSDCDPAGTNADGGLEIFRAVVGQDPVQISSCVPTAPGSCACSSQRPSISGDGSRIAFESNCNLTGNNGDGNVEIFLWKNSQGGGNISQLTTSNGCDNLAPSISGSGEFIAFDSTCNTSGTNNNGKGSQIFRVTHQGTLKQLTDDEEGACDSTSASISQNGSVVAFDSDCDLTGDNEDLAIEIFTVNANSLEVRQRTFAPEDSCSSVHPAIDGAASIIAFHSDCNFVGLNADRNDEIYTVDNSDLVRQVTNVGSGSQCASGETRMASSGRAIAFSSYCLLNGSNGDRSVEVFQAGIGASSGGIFAVTNAGGCSSAAGGINSDGSGVLFDSDCNLASDNPDGSVEIFRGTACTCAAPSTRKAAPSTSDALYILRASVGSASCARCECDVNNSGAINVADALLTLRAAVGQLVNIVCPAP